MVFTSTRIHFICSQDKASLLEGVIKPAKEVGVEVVVDVKAKHDSGINQMDSLLRSIISLSHSDVSPTTIGYIASEGEFLKIWADKLNGSGLRLSDTTNALSALFAVKTRVGINSVRKGGYLIDHVMDKFVIPKVEVVIDLRQAVAHSSLKKYTEDTISSAVSSSVGTFQNVRTCYPPMFRSGGNFSLQPNAKTNDDDFLNYGSPGVIICAFGVRNNGYCSNIARTFLVNSSAELIKAYNVLYKAHEVAIHAFKPGRKISSVYEAARAVVERNAPQLVSKLTGSVGAGIGLEFQESFLDLNAEIERLIKAGMTFNVSLRFENLEAKTSKPNSQISMLLADTVIVRKQGTDVVTSDSKKDPTSVVYSFREGDPEVTVESNEKDEVAKMMKNECLKKHQSELALLKKKEIVSRFTGKRHRRNFTKKADVDKLVLGDGIELIKLQELCIRSSTSRKLQLSGTLQAHANGFRYSTPGNEECVDVIYANIKHAFFQPAEKEVITLVHFFLHKDIKVGAKKTNSIQFYVETLKFDSKTASVYDPDQMLIETSRKDRVNTAFHDFVNQMHALWGQPQFQDLKLRFDQPLRNLGFFGKRFKYKSFIVPTSSCLVELIDTQFFCVSLDVIDIISLERVGEHNSTSSKTFDLMIVFKDFGRTRTAIREIPLSSLDGIKEWLDAKDILYYESSENLNWDRILLNIMHRLKEFVDGGGWEFLKNQDKVTTWVR